jgi:hypothetical protein
VPATRTRPGSHGQSRSLALAGCRATGASASLTQSGGRGTGMVTVTRDAGCRVTESESATAATGNLKPEFQPE